MKLLLHPLPVRIFHWTMVTSVVILLATGFYIHHPPLWLQWPMSLVRKLHGCFGLILAVNLAGQVYYYIATGKFTEVLLLPRDWAHMRSFLRYYLFVTEHHPNFGRYNPGQKMLFTTWGLAVTTGTVTGLGLLFPDHSVWLQKALGGLSVLRAIQYSIGIFFVTTIPLHLYLVFTEEPAKLQAMFTGFLQKEPKLPVAAEAADKTGRSWESELPGVQTEER